MGVFTGATLAETIRRRRLAQNQGMTQRTREPTADELAVQRRLNDDALGEQLFRIRNTPRAERTPEQVQGRRDLEVRRRLLRDATRGDASIDASPVLGERRSTARQILGQDELAADRATELVEAIRRAQVRQSLGSIAESDLGATRANTERERMMATAPQELEAAQGDLRSRIARNQLEAMLAQSQERGIPMEEDVRGAQGRTAIAEGDLRRRQLSLDLERLNDPEISTAERSLLLAKIEEERRKATAPPTPTLSAQEQIDAAMGTMVPGLLAEPGTQEALRGSLREQMGLSRPNIRAQIAGQPGMAEFEGQRAADLGRGGLRRMIGMTTGGDVSDVQGFMDREVADLRELSRVDPAAAAVRARTLLEQIPEDTLAGNLWQYGPVGLINRGLGGGQNRANRRLMLDAIRNELRAIGYPAQ